MPANDKLAPIQFPQELKFGQRPTTEFVNNLESISVRLLSSPSMEDLAGYIPQFVKATWMESTKSCDDMDLAEKYALIQDVFFGRTLPTAQETINLVFEIDGISLQEVTHILRHRGASFSADCSADKWWTDKRALVPAAIQNSNSSTIHGRMKGFHERYQEIVEAAKELYCDMIDSRDISILDARYILPRCLETFYYMRMPLKDALAFIKQRIDRQIQPETDNIIAYQMYMAILERYPIANGLIDIDAPAWHYINTARSGKSSNIYMPEPNSDRFEYHPDDFIYSTTRNTLNGTDQHEDPNDGTWYKSDNWFEVLHDGFLHKLFHREQENDKWLKKECGCTNEELPALTVKFREE